MITETYDDITEPLISLEEFYGEPKKRIDKCIIVFSHVIYDYLLEKFDCEKIADIGGCDGLKPIYKFFYQDMEITFYKSPLGSMGAAQATIEVNWITGADKFIMFGSCGNLNEEITTGKYVIPTEAYRDEGMSYHYAPAADYITIKNSDKVAEIFEELKIPYVQGRTWTTEAVLRETKGNVIKRRNEGCLVVEMEVAGVQAVSDYYGYELYDFLAPGDLVTVDERTLEGLSEANHNIEKLYIALEIAKRI